MQDVSGLIGSPCEISVRGEMVAVSAMTFEDIGVLQKSLRDKKRVDILDTALLFKGKLEPQEFMALLETARAEATAVEVYQEEFTQWLNRMEGATELLYVLLSRQHPDKKFTRNDAMLAMKSLQDDEVGRMKFLEAIQGVDVGNATGQTKTPAT